MGDILDACDKLMALCADMDFDAFAESWIAHHAAFSLLEIVGEASARLSAGLRDGHPEVPWSAMRGMRNVLIHGYATVDLVSVWKTLEHDVPNLHRQVTALRRED